MEDKNKVAISRIDEEIAKIDKKENTVYFFVLDTKGNPSGSLEYIYKLAMILKENKYNVAMLYQLAEGEEFVGVREWLGDKYADLTHEDIGGEDVKVSPSDILFIPEIYANVMIQTKNLPCKRIALLQNYDYILEQMPMASQWGNIGIMDCLTNTELNKQLLTEIFPYVKTHVVEPYIDDIYGETTEPKKLIINIISKNQEDINKIIKPFYWKYPAYKFISFRDLRGYPKEKYSEMLREAAITIYVDDNTSFGYGALEAMKSGSIVIAKTPNMAQRWMENDEKTNLRDCCVWFDNFHELHRIIASVIRSWMADSVPSEIKENAKKSLEMYSYESTEKNVLEYIVNILENRKKEMESIKVVIKEKSKEGETDE